MSKIDLTGQRFGRLVVLEESERRYSKGRNSERMWKCRCDCGNIKKLSTGNLTTGNTKSCGCFKRELLIKSNTTHQMSKTKLYHVWSSMKDRCFNPKYRQYLDYGGRGITVCEEWKNDFLLFYEWSVENGYKEGLTIERIDVNGNYCPENCCWIPKEVQPRNRRNTHYITFRGQTKTLSEWSRELHVDRECLRNKEKKLGSGELAIIELLNSPRHIIRKL